MRVVITGSTGLVGRALTAALVGRGDAPVRVVRESSPHEHELVWSIEDGFAEKNALAGVDAVVNLAGESIGAGRWTDARKRRLHDSRVLGTRRVVEAIARARPRPRVLINASAVGYYGDCGDEPVDESRAAGQGFLAELCAAWEHEARAAEALGVRVVITRSGIALAKGAPALAKLALPFRIGLGARLGSGQQYFPWIHLDDLVRALLFVLDRDDLTGAFNTVAPAPSTNAELTRALGRALRRPAFLVAPAFVLRLMLGELAGPLALEGQRALPKRLMEAGFDFDHDDLQSALEAVV